MELTPEDCERQERKPGAVQSIGRQRIRHNWATEQQQYIFYNNKKRNTLTIGLAVFLYFLHEKQIFREVWWLVQQEVTKPRFEPSRNLIPKFPFSPLHSHTPPKCCSYTFWICYTHSHTQPCVPINLPFLPGFPGSPTVDASLKGWVLNLWVFGISSLKFFGG